MKRKVLIVSDSPFIDTGFGRVGREIGTGLHLTGKFDVTYLGWFHQPTDKLIPFRVIPTDISTMAMAQADLYAAVTFPKVLAKVKPDVILVMGDEWMIKHLALTPRKCPMIGYVPIDGIPIMPQWVQTFAALDQFVAYGDFGESAVHYVRQDFPVAKIPHGVDTTSFYPLSTDARAECRRLLDPSGEKFIVGCVARNNPRKNLPLLLKAFRKFSSAATTCNACGNVHFAPVLSCPSCQSKDLVISKSKENVLLYMHTVPDDQAGHKLVPLVHRHGLSGKVGFPEGMRVGNGVSDFALNRLYNAMDIFTLPTTGEGWGLPILEAMAAGLPVLVTEYSAHLEFVHGAGELIQVSDYQTSNASNVEHAICDQMDYVFKLDRFYYEREEFLRKWGPYMRLVGGIPAEVFDKIAYGKSLREELASKAAKRAAGYDWKKVVPKWIELIDGMVPERRSATGLNRPLQLEVFK